MLKKLASCALTLLVTATLLWGGCLSCSQYFMVPVAGENSCCNPAGECVPAQQGQKDDGQSGGECRIQQVTLSDASFDLQHAAISMAAAAVVPVAIYRLPEFVGFFNSESALLSTSPPDLCLLHSVFRI